MLAASGGTRTHAFAMSVFGWRVRCWYYDSAGMVFSETISIRDDFSTFAAIIVGFAFLDANGWGEQEVVRMDAEFPYSSLQEGTITLSPPGKKAPSYDVILGNLIYERQLLVGHYTTVYEASCAAGPYLGQKCVVKISQQVCTGAAE